MKFNKQHQATENAAATTSAHRSDPEFSPRSGVEVVVLVVVVLANRGGARLRTHVAVILVWRIYHGTGTHWSMRARRRRD